MTFDLVEEELAIGALWRNEIVRFFVAHRERWNANPTRLHAIRIHR